MSRRERLKQRYKEFTGDAKELLKRKDKGSSSSSTPSIIPPHTTFPTAAGQIGGLQAAVSEILPPAQASISSPTIHLNVSSGADDRPEPLPDSGAQITEDHLVVRQPSLGPSESQVLRDADANVNLGTSHARLNESNTPQPSEHGVIRQHPGMLSTGTDIKVFVKGAARSVANVLKVGPLQDVFDLFGVLGDTYKMEGSIEKEYEALQTRLKMVLDRLDSEFAGGSSPKMIGIGGLRKSIETELKIVENKQGRSRHSRYLKVQKDADEIQACYRRIAGYWEQLTLDTNHEIRKMVEEHSKAQIDRVSSLIDRLPSSTPAWYDSSTGADLKRRECTPGTRIRVLAQLLDWACERNNKGVYWLNGMAGTGKTTIAYSVCRELASKRNLAASFFCSRLRQECRDVNLIIPSIAYQLARRSPSFQLALSVLLEKEPDIHTKRLPIQFKALIQEPLLETQSLCTAGMVVVIDALDECDNKESTRDILGLLLNDAPDLPIRFIVSSRPEPQIRDQMTGERNKSRLVLHELDKGEVKADVEKYLREGLAPMSPSDEQIAALVEKAGILFIYAATAVRYIGYDNFQSDPIGRLHDILDGPQSPEDGGHYSEIDQLYMTILEAAIGNRNLRTAQRKEMRQVLYSIICAQEPLTVESLSKLLDINDIQRVRAALRPLWSVLHIVGAHELVTTLHASFPDFMFDSARSRLYYCDSNAHHRRLAEHCLEYIARTQPQFNICGLESSYLSDEEVPDIQTRVAESISSELLYACRYWADHIKAANCASSFVEQIQDFLSTRLLLWMEVLNLTNQMKAGMGCVKLAAEWCEAFEEERKLAELAHDAKRFVEAFASNPVSQSTPHIYVSMLTFWPRSAPISKYYAVYTQGPIGAEGTALEQRQLALSSTWAFARRIAAMDRSSDGLHIALAAGNDVLVVELSSGKEVLAPLRGHLNEVQTVAFSLDGFRILASSRGHHDLPYIIILGWDIRTGDTVFGPLQLRRIMNFTYCLSFSSDYSRIATGSEDKIVRLWNADTGELLHRLRVQEIVYATVFSPDGTQVAAGAGKTLHRWDSRTGKSIHTPMTHAVNIHKATYPIDRSWIISGCGRSGTIYLWNALSGDMIGSIEEHTAEITCIGYSPDGRYIVSGSADRSVRVWDAQGGNMVLGPLEGHTDKVISVVFSLDGSRVISACEGGLVCTWDARQRNQARRSTSTPSDPITCARFSSDGTRFVSGSMDGALHIWDVHTGEVVLGPIKVHSSSITAVDFKNNHVVSGAIDGKICVWDTRSGEVMLGPLEVDSEAIEAIAYSPDGELIVTGSSARVNVRNAQDGRRILGPLTHLDYNVRSVQFSPDGTRIISSSDGDRSNVVVRDVSDGRNLFGSLRGHLDGVRSVSYSPNGALIASASDDCTIIFWDAYTGKKVLGPLTGHSDRVYSVSFSPDSTRLVSGSADRTIRIWDVRAGDMVFELLHGHEDCITWVEYSPDGTRILSRCKDMSVRIHDARSPEERVQSHSEAEVGDWTVKKDGWVVDDQSRPLAWVPGDLRKALMWSETRVMVGPQGYVRLKFDKSRTGESWTRSYTSHM